MSKKEEEGRHPGAEVEPTRGWFEEYSCGCVSPVVRRKRDLPGWCGVHGNDRRHVHRIHPNLDRRKWKED